MSTMTMRKLWGWRARFGILVIDKDPVAETEFWSLAADGIGVHAARFESPRQPGTDSYGDDPGRRVAETPGISTGLGIFGQMRLDAICLCFVTSSFLGGTKFDERFADLGATMAEGIPVCTGAQAITAAAAELRIRRPFVVVAPWFKDEILAAAVEYFAEAGMPPAAVHRFGLGAGWDAMPPWQTWDAGAQWSVRPQDLYRQVRGTIPEDADGVIIAGSGFRAIEVVEPLEADLGVPVLTSNQAGMWRCLRLAGVTAATGGAGRLLS
jgi:maleate isomerase